MTNMKRMTVSLTDELETAIVALKNQDEFKNAPYSEIIRFLVKCGLESSGVQANKSA